MTPSSTCQVIYENCTFSRHIIGPGPIPGLSMFDVGAVKSYFFPGGKDEITSNRFAGHVRTCSTWTDPLEPFQMRGVQIRNRRNYLELLKCGCRITVCWRLNVPIIRACSSTLETNGKKTCSHNHLISLQKHCKQETVCRAVRPSANRSFPRKPNENLGYDSTTRRQH